MMNTNKYYPVIYVCNSGEKVRKIVNSKAPYNTPVEAIQHAYEANYPANHVEAGYTFFDGSKWVAETGESYEEGRMDDPDFMTRPQMCHNEANYRLDCESRGFY